MTLASVPPPSEPEPEPRRYTVRLPLGEHWSSLDLMDAMRAFPDGFHETVPNGDGTDAPTPWAVYLQVVADLWLQMRRDEPDIGWRDVAESYSAVDYGRDVERIRAAQSQEAGAHGPKARGTSTRKPRATR